MTLPDALCQALAALVELPLPWAVRLLRRVALLEESEAAEVWEQEWQQATPLRRGGLIAHLGEICAQEEKCRAVLGVPRPPAIFYRWQQRVGGQLEAVTGTPMLPYNVSSELYYLAEESTQLSVSANGGTPQEWRALAEKIRGKQAGFLGLRKNNYYDEILARTLISLGMAHRRAGKLPPAVAAFLEAIELADALENLGVMVLACSQLGGLYLYGYGKVKDGLKVILPLWQKYQAGPPSLDLVALAHGLANIYNFTKDPVDTKYFLDRSAELLAAAGFPLAPDQSLAESLLFWTRKAKARNEEGPLHYNDFLRALTIWGSHYFLRSNWAPSPAAHRALDARVNALEEGRHQVAEIFNQQVSTDNALLRQLHDYNIDDPRKFTPDFTAKTKARDRKIDQALQEEVISKDLLKDIQALLAASPTPFSSMQHLWREGTAYQKLGEMAAAANSFQQARAIAEKSGGIDDVLRAILWQTRLIPVSAGEEVLALCLQGVTKMEAARQDVITPYQQVTFFQGRTEVYRMAMAWARSVEDWEHFFGVGDLLKARNFFFPMVEAGAMRNLRERLEGFYRRLQKITEPQARQALLRERQLEYDNWLLAHFSANLEWPLRLPLEKLWRALEVAEALLTYYRIRPDVWAVVLITGAGGHRNEVVTIATEKLEDWLAAIGNLGAPGPNYRSRGMSAYTGTLPIRPVKVVPSPKRALASLGEVLLPEAIRAGLLSCERLFICPHQELHQVPFHALPWQGGRFLIEAFAISYLPNLHSLLYKDAAFNCKRSVAVIGTDLFADRDGTFLSALPGAREEVEALAAFYAAQKVPVTRYIGDQATRKALMQAAAEASLIHHDILHLALHGENVAANAPLDTRLFVHDGSIDGFDITNWKLTAELVVLSACYAGVRSVAGRGLAHLPGDDVFGLQAAFFAAGARRVLGAMWPVDDVAGKELMLAFHRHLQQWPPAQAWRQTVITYLAEAPAQRRELAYWAPFFLAEEGREKDSCAP